MSEESDLTDLESDDSFQRDPSGKKKDISLTGLSLKAPRVAGYSTKTLYESLHNGFIDIDVDYQRDVVWADASKSKLIESIMRNFYVPPVLFRVVEDVDGKELWRCIDGKQRLTSIQRFMDGLIPYIDPNTGRKFYYKITDGSTKKNILPAKLVTVFSMAQISCVLYSDLAEDQEREMFQRVQLGSKLTTAETQKAISSPRADYVRSLVKVYMTENGGIPQHIDLDISRGRDFADITHLVTAIERMGLKELSDKAFGSAPKRTAWLKETTAIPPETLKRKLVVVLDIFLGLARDKTLCPGLRTTNRLAPVEYVGVGLLIAYHMDKLSVRQIAEAIKEMRTITRSKHGMQTKDNKSVHITMANYIFKKCGSGGTVGIPATQDKAFLADLPGTQGKVPITNAVPTVNGVPKRKRGMSTDSDTPLQKKAITKTTKTTKPSLTNKISKMNLDDNTRHLAKSSRPSPAQAAPKLPTKAVRPPTPQNRTRPPPATLPPKPITSINTTVLPISQPSRVATTSAIPKSPPRRQSAMAALLKTLRPPINFAMKQEPDTEITALSSGTKDELTFGQPIGLMGPAPSTETQQGGPSRTQGQQSQKDAQSIGSARVSSLAPLNTSSQVTTGWGQQGGWGSSEQQPGSSGSPSFRMDTQSPLYSMQNWPSRDLDNRYPSAPRALRGAANTNTNPPVGSTPDQGWGSKAKH